MQIPRSALPAFAVLFIAMGCGRIGYDGERDAGAAGDAANDGPLTYARLILVDDPRAYFRLGERSGEVVIDSSDQGQPRVVELLNATATLGAQGALADDDDTAIRFDGGGNETVEVDYATVQVKPPAALWAGDFTIEALVRTDRPATDSFPLFICEDYMQRGFRAGWTDARTLRFWNDEAGGTTNLFSNLGLIDIDVWQHIAFVRRGDEIEMYLDGLLVGGGPLTGYNAPISSPSVECGFGSFHGMPLHATIDELAIYDRALDAGRIAEHATRAGR